MIISVASGKGGTGKTTVAVNLALFLAQEPSCKVQFLDCDVEEPNAHLFLKPEIRSSESVTIPVPEIDREKCTCCGKCAEVCAYNALAVLREEVMVFEQLCHGCGGCAVFCPEGAISEREREVGVLEAGTAGAIDFVHGRLNIGEAMPVPLIRAVKRRIVPDALTMIDVPPGTSCPVVESLKGSDYALLVTEPTPFGLHDLKLAASVARELGIRSGVIINRADLGDQRVREYCEKEAVPILGEIPYDHKLARLYSTGNVVLDQGQEYREVFGGIWDSVRADSGIESLVSSG